MLTVADSVDKTSRNSNGTSDYLRIGKLSPVVKKYRATKMATLLSVFPTAVGTAPKLPKTMFWKSLYM